MKKMMMMIIFNFCSDIQSDKDEKDANLYANCMCLRNVMQPAGGCLLAMGSMIYKEISRCNNTL